MDTIKPNFNGSDDDDLTEITESDFYIETESDVSLYVKDYGKGKPVVLLHGWPLSGEMWEYQIETLVKNNFRVITYDRRGFGKSSHPWSDYDYDNLADDLKEVIDELGLEEFALVGFSMGGGEVARYFSRHGGQGVSKVVFISSVTPFMLKTPDNEDGLPMEEFDKMSAQIREDRMAFLEDFGKKFYGVGMLSKPVSAAYLQNDMVIAASASPRATLECLEAFAKTDFRDDMRMIDVPTLFIHGDADKTVPIEASSEKAVKLVANSQYITYEGAPHGLFYTEKDRLNNDLIAFLNT
ncbi:MAG TPA: alpha/beta hydrolase [Flavobacterium sp.]|jgi:pimeloyl-ACP methyl ester carboxylesterase